MSAFDKTIVVEDTVENYLEHLVGDDKKFTDNEALAKGKYEADKHVNSLETQITELREDLVSSGKIDELMELVRENQRTVEKIKEDPLKEGSDDTSSGQLTTEELKTLIETHVTERDTVATRKRNLEEADLLMTKMFGDKAAQVVANKASELGMSVKEMQEIAERNPKAFTQLVGVSNNRSTDSGDLIGGSQRSEGDKIRSGGSRDFAFYQEMRRKDRHTYYSPKMQLQMIKDAEAMGDAFGGFNS